MKKNKNLISALDIGSSKLSCMQTITDNNGITKVLGFSIIATKGIKSGIVTDFNLASECILKAINDCEKQSGEIIKELTVSISSHKCFTKIIRSKVEIKDEKVTENDIQACINKTLEDDYLFDKKVINFSYGPYYRQG